MKKWLSYYQSYMVRPILYKVVARSAIAVAVLLLWNRYVNTGGQLSLGRDGCFVVGVLFLAFAWFSYLKFDGVSFHHLFEKREGEKRNRSAGEQATSSILQMSTSCRLRS